MIDFVATFIFFFAVIDPIGTIPVFLAVTARHDASERRWIALRATLVSAAILVFFVVAGEIILASIDIPLSAFEIAGGIVLFLFALTMIFGEGKPEHELKLTASNSETAVFPLAVPSISSPGAMLAAVLLTDNNRFNYWQQAQTTAMIFAVLLVTLACMLAASRLHRYIGDSGANIISRVMGLILASVATASVLSGLKEYFSL